jgi:hypothetical protein
MQVASGIKLILLSTHPLADDVRSGNKQVAGRISSSKHPASSAKHCQHQNQYEEQTSNY